MKLLKNFELKVLTFFVMGFWSSRSNTRKRDGPPKADNNEPTRKRSKLFVPITRQNEEDMDDRSSFKGKEKGYITSDESKRQVSNEIGRASCRERV